MRSNAIVRRNPSSIAHYPAHVHHLLGDDKIGAFIFHRLLWSMNQVSVECRIHLASDELDACDGRSIGVGTLL